MNFNKKDLEKEIQEEFEDFLQSIKTWATITIYLYNNKTDDYECAQFDVENLNKASGIDELYDLLSTFCEENDLSDVDLNAVYFVRDADSYEELMQLEAEEEGYCFREED